MNRRVKGNRFENLACRLLERKGFAVWRPPKSRWSRGVFSSDIFHCGDILAVKKNRFLLIAVAHGRAQTRTRRALEWLRKNCPKSVFLEYWIYKDGKREKGWEIIHF